MSQLAFSLNIVTNYEHTLKPWKIVWFRIIAHSLGQIFNWEFIVAWFSWFSHKNHMKFLAKISPLYIFERHEMSFSEWKLSFGWKFSIVVRFNFMSESEHWPRSEYCKFVCVCASNLLHVTRFSHFTSTHESRVKTKTKRWAVHTSV